MAIGRDDREVIDARSAGRTRADVGASLGERLVDGARRGADCPFRPSAAREIGLRIEVDEQDALARPSRARPPRLMAVVVLATPPFWLATAMILRLFGHIAKLYRYWAGQLSAVGVKESARRPGVKAMSCVALVPRGTRAASVGDCHVEQHRCDRYDRSKERTARISLGRACCWVAATATSKTASRRVPRLVQRRKEKRTGKSTSDSCVPGTCRTSRTDQSHRLPSAPRPLAAAVA